MAAGLCVARDRFDDFVAAITEYANEHISPDQLVKTVRPDAFAELDEITQGSAVDIEKVGPFGIGNPTPIVQINNVTIDQVSVLGSKGAHLTMQLGQSNKRIRAIWWSMGDAAKQLQRGVQIDIVAKIKVNEFRGTRTAELDIIDIALPSG
jgi:single-stranded-DNA-specific exonuclease